MASAALQPFSFAIPLFVYCLGLNYFIGILPQFFFFFFFIFFVNGMTSKWKWNVHDEQEQEQKLRSLSAWAQLHTRTLKT